MSEHGTFWVFPADYEPLGRSGEDMIVSDGEGVEAVEPCGTIPADQIHRMWTAVLGDDDHDPRVSG